MCTSALMGEGGECARLHSWGREVSVLMGREGGECTCICTCRYDNSGCGRSYLSLRDLEAHRLYRHTKDKGLGQAAHLTAPPPQAHMAGFLPQFFQMPVSVCVCNL